jgi:hypothetical protein
MGVSMLGHDNAGCFALTLPFFDESSLRAVFAKQSLAQIASGFALAMTDHILRGLRSVRAAFLVD